MSQLKRTRADLFREILTFAGFAAVVVFLLWKCKYSFAKEDESFYLTIPYRLLQGDGLFVHEWHLSQMASVFLLPPVFLYTKLTGGTEGMLLAFRYLYVFFWTLGSLVLYARMRKITRTGAAAAALSFLIYAPFGISALSYNSIGILCLTLALILICTGKEDRLRSFLPAGVLFAVAVLCCPFLFGVYVLYTLIGWICALCRRNKTPVKAWFRRWLLFTLGAAVVALLFMFFVFRRASVSEILRALPLMLEDPEHNGVSVTYKLISYCRCVVDCVPYSFAAYGCTFLLALFLKKRQAARGILCAVTMVEIAVLLLLLWRKHPHINYLMFPLNLFPPIAWILFPSPQMHKWMLFGYLPGMLYTVCLHYSSNQAFYAISSASTVATVSSLLILVVCLRTVWCSDARKPLRVLCLCSLSLLLGLQFVSQLQMRYQSLFWDTDMSDQTYLVSQGPEKGLLVREELAAKYEALARETAPIRSDPQVRGVLYLSMHTWLYLLDGEKENAAFSAWLSGVNENTLTRLETYYTLHPEKAPDAVYYEWSDAPELREEVTTWLNDRFGFTETAVGQYGSVFEKTA